MTAVAGSVRRSTTGRFVLIDRIGGGAHGEVWRARGEDGTLVAVKLLGGPGVTKEARLRFFQEQAFRFDHPNVAGPRGVTEFDDVQALVMDLVDGTDLRDLAVTNGGTLPDAVLLAIAHDTLAGLDYLHANAVVHRDISPGNLLVSRTGDRLVTRIGDFGTALDLDGGRLTATPGVVVGTHGFTAPELYRGEDATPRSDLWSLGATLRSVRAPAASDTPDADPTAATLTLLIDRLCAEDPAARPASARAALGLLPDEPTPPTPPAAAITVPTLPALPRRRSRAIVAVVVVLALVGAGFVAVRHNRPAARPTTWQRIIDSTIRTGYDSAVAHSRSGRVLVAHTDFTAGRLLLTICDDDVCARPRTRVLDGQPRSGYYPALVLDAADRPVVAYQDSGRTRLVVRRCTDSSCNGSTVDVVPIAVSLQESLRRAFTVTNPNAGAGDISLHPQLALDGERVVVAYDDAQANHVMLAQRDCARPSCPWRTIDLGAGAGSTVALVSGGRPVVAGTARYSGNTEVPSLTGALWFTVCVDRRCTRHARTETRVLAEGPVLVPTPTGVVAVASIYDTSLGPNSLSVTTLRTAGCARSGCPPPETHRIAMGEEPEAPSVALAGERLVVAYKVSNVDAPGLAVAVCPDLTCRRQPQQTLVNRNRDIFVASSGHDPSLVVDDDELWVSHSVLPPGTVSTGRLAMFHTSLR